MRVENRTPWYSDAEVSRLVHAAVAAGPRRPRPRLVVVLPRTLPRDTRQGYTPYDHGEGPVQIWLQPPWWYPQGPKARTWQQELTMSVLHEMEHYRDGSCRGPACETTAETYAQTCYRIMRSGRRVRCPAPTGLRAAARRRR